MTVRRIQIILDTRQAKKNADGLNKSTQDVARSANSAQFSMNKLAAAIAAVVSVQQIVKYADSWTRVENQLKRTTKSQEDLAATSSILLGIANDTRAALEPTVELYTSLTVATRSLGVSQAQISGVTKTINNLFLESGKGAAETAGAIRQLGQALESGALRGDEFNSVAEGAPGILRAVEKQTGLTRGELRDLAAQGKITAELLVTSLQNYSEEAQRAADKTSSTLGQSFDVAGNNFTYLIGRINKATGASDGLAEAIISISNAIANPQVLDNMEAFGKLIGVGIGQTVQRVTAELRFFGKIIANPFDGDSRAAAWDEFQQDVRNINQLTSDSIDLMVEEREQIRKTAQARKESGGSIAPTGVEVVSGAPGGDREIASAKAVTAALAAELSLRTQTARIYREGVLREDASLYDQQLALIQIKEAEQLAQIEIRAAADRQRREDAFSRLMESENLSGQAKFMLKQEQDAQILLADQLMEEQRTQILQEGKKAREDLDRAEAEGRLAMIGQAGTQLMNLSRGQSKKMFKIGQALALAQAAAALPSAVVQSYNNGGGYPWGLIPAGLMLATGLQQINAIKNAGKGIGAGGGGGASIPPVSGGGAGAGGGIGAPTTASMVQETQQKRIIDLRGVASTDKLTIAQFAQLMEEDGAIVTLENARMDAARRNVIGAGA